MSNLRLRPFLHFIVVLAVFLSAASPACKFISGGMLEICAADGSLKNIALPDGYQSPDAPVEKEKAAKDDCPFCFAQTHLKSNKTADIAIVAYTVFVMALIAAWASGHYRRYELDSLSARAPPLR